MITRFRTSVIAPLRVGFARLTLAVASFFAANFDDIMDGLSFVEGQLDDFIDRQQARIDADEEAVTQSFLRESQIMVQERSLRVDLDNDATDAAAAIGRAQSVRDRVRGLTGSAE